MESDNEGSKKKSNTAPIVIAVAVIIAVLATAGWITWSALQKSDTTRDDNSQTTSEASKNDASSDASSSSETATITFTDSGFSPSTLTVKSGTVVTVVNNSSQSLQFSSDDHPTHREDPEINMDVLASGEKGTFTATTTGTHSFHDHLDDSKVGTLIVE